MWHYVERTERENAMNGNFELEVLDSVRFCRVYLSSVPLQVHQSLSPEFVVGRNWESILESLLRTGLGLRKSIPELVTPRVFSVEKIWDTFKDLLFVRIIYQQSTVI